MSSNVKLLKVYCDDSFYVLDLTAVFTELLKIFLAILQVIAFFMPTSAGNNNVTISLDYNASKVSFISPNVR